MFVIAIQFISCGYTSGEKFDSEKWKSSNLDAEQNWSLRWDMMNSLRNDYELKGKNKNEIFKLLGKPDSESQSEFNYYLGYSKRGINTGTLTFYVGANGEILDVAVWDG